MKVCRICEAEIDTPDGENLCAACERDGARRARNKRVRANRRAMNEAMRSIGMTKVRGAMGGTYWE